MTLRLNLAPGLTRALERLWRELQRIRQGHKMLQ